MAYLSSRIHCASCGEDLEIVFSAPTPGTLADYFAGLTVGIAGTPIAPDTTTCPKCGGNIGDHSGDGDDPDEKGRRVMGEKTLSVRYLTKLPDVIPAGRVLVHSHVRPTRRLGLRGARAWLSRPDPAGLEVCGCDWAPELGRHFRVKLKGGA